MSLSEPTCGSGWTFFTGYSSSKPFLRRYRGLESVRDWDIDVGEVLMDVSLGPRHRHSPDGTTSVTLIVVPFDQT